MHSVHNTLQEAFQNQGSYQESSSIDSYFDEAKQGLLRDLVDFQNRDDFDSYMKSLEKTYYQKQNITQPPYQQFPDFPPKPFQDSKRKKSDKGQTKDYIDQVHEINQKRQQAYSHQTIQQQQQVLQQQQQMQYMQQHYANVNPMMNPFFDQVVNKENAQQQMTNFTMNQSHAQNQNGIMGGQMHNPAYHQGGMNGYQNPVIDTHGKYMEPRHLVNNAPYLQRFVAGPQRLEQNPLGEPMRNLKNGNSPGRQPNQPQLQLNDYDLKNPDVQYERYKHLMSNQFYNTNVNSLNTGFNLTGAHTFYQPPSVFVQQQQQAQAQQQHQQLPINNQYQHTFNPQVQNTLQNLPATTTQTPNLSQRGVYPQAQQIYHQPVSLYSNPPHAQLNPQIVPANTMNHPLNQQSAQSLYGGMPNGISSQYGPAFYRSITTNNQVPQTVIESIGGIENTLKPLEETLKQHELRPYQIQRDYKKEYQYSQRGKSLKRSFSEHNNAQSIQDLKNDSVKLVSVSPFRAVVKVNPYAQSHSHNRDESPNSSASSDDSDIQQDDFARSNPHQQHQLNNSQNRNNSRSQQIRNDSQNLRGQREDFLGSFQDRRGSFHNNSNSGTVEVQNNEGPGIASMQAMIGKIVGNGSARDDNQQKIKIESEHLRGQRENFLQGFSLPPMGPK
eukprot:403376790